MCGRIAIYASSKHYAELFGVTPDFDFMPCYNIPPSSQIPACRINPEGVRELVLLRWGLVPHWSKGPDSRFSMINARAETVHEKPAYRTAFKKQRCLIPVDGFYEWTKRNGKQPYYIHRQDYGPLVFAGLWEHWQDKEGKVIDSCTIIVTEANARIQSIHDRMPAILEPPQFDAWLDPANQRLDDLGQMLRPYAKTGLEIYPVSRMVNSPKNDSPDLLKRLPDQD